MKHITLPLVGGCDNKVTIFLGGNVSIADYIGANTCTLHDGLHQCGWKIDMSRDDVVTAIETVLLS